MTPKTKYILKGAVIGTVVGVWFLYFLAPVIGALIALFMWNKKQAAVKKAAAEAAIRLGCQYYDGDGVEKDIRKAFECWSQNIEALDAKTALKLADMYRDGEVTEKDLKKAFPLYQRAPRQDAEQRIMEIYEQGTDLPEYTRYAAESYTRRFENGEDELLNKLIALYTSLGDGENLKKYQIIAAKKGDRTLAAKLGKELFGTDKAAAYPLLCLADGDGDPEIFFMRACILENGDGAEQNLAAAKEYYQKAMDAGYEPASRHLAPLLLESPEKAEREQAFSLYSAWADKGDADAKFKVADMLARGIGTAPDAAKALAVWRDLTETGCHAALLKIAEAYRTGSGCERDLAQAMEFAEKATEAKVKGAKKLLDELKEEKAAEIQAEKEAVLNAAIAACDSDATGEAELQVARLYEAGKVAAKSPKKAFEYYQKAADKGNAEALYRLGTIAENGSGVLHRRPDIALALELYERAGKQGSREAEKALESIRKKIENLEQKIRELNFSEWEELVKLLVRNTPVKYVEYEIPYSICCSSWYPVISLAASRKKSLDFNKSLASWGENFDASMKDWTPDDQDYWDSNDVKKLAIGFIYATGHGDNEKSWHCAGKLISQGVYWPLVGFYKYFDGVKSMSILCAMKMHGCLEAVGLFAKILAEAQSDADLKAMLSEAMELAKEIDAGWLEKRSREMDFPLMSEVDDPDGSGEETTTPGDMSDFPKFYSFSDLDAAINSDDPEVRNWAIHRMEIAKKSLEGIKEDRNFALDHWAHQLEIVLERKYSHEKFDPHIPTPKMTEMGMSSGDHVLYVYCQLVWRCHARGYMRSFKQIFNEDNTTDMEYLGEWLVAISRNQVDAEWLAGMVGVVLMDDKVLSDDFLSCFDISEEDLVYIR